MRSRTRVQKRSCESSLTVGAPVTTGGDPAGHGGLGERAGPGDPALRIGECGVSAPLSLFSLSRIVLNLWLFRWHRSESNVRPGKRVRLARLTNSPGLNSEWSNSNYENVSSSSDHRFRD
ncbi:hypothetical protein Pmani_012702 [Petrolisthes manimaculis]|uniref:Uncharacterized protein n=1 Tax=Petrolisthes manimaculis TaxID=1843537 RepID=A0AAE1PXI6_9EUCA|nr:hypothetical protein Pmani_012702 [Petrolisthes manimaculis]